MNRYKSKEFKALEFIQNNYYPNQDILTITGYMGDEEFLKHVNRCKKTAMLKILNK